MNLYQVILKHIIFFSILIIHTNLYSQLNITTGVTPQQLVQNVLIGNGVTASTITYTGSNQAIGQFSNGNTTNLGLNSGIILSTGKAIEAAGPVSFTPSTGFGLGGDPQLQNLISQTVYDAAVLQFDFIPTADTLRFRYVFGSDEYPEYVNSYNDVFGFFITGPNPAGGVYSNKNIALIPGTTLPVTINNINNVNPSFPQYYIDNQAIGGTTITYDGFTTVLTAWVLVVPCAQYHIKIAIGDAGDNILDSGVFLEANSFSSNAVNFTTSYTSNIDTNAVEGCNSAIITFSLPNPLPTQQVIHFNILGTAINGVDYTHIADSIIIPAGQTSTSITISPINDGISEPTESVYLVFQSSPCSYDTVKIYIKDYEVLTGSFTSPVVCGPNVNSLSFNTSNGFPPINYIWNTGETTAQININPINSTSYNITVSDACGTIVTDSILVDIVEANLNYQDVLCFNESSGSASINVINGVAPFTYTWNTNPVQNTSSVTNLSAGSYTVTITDKYGCMLEIPFTINQPPILNLTLTLEDEKCFNSCNGKAIANINGGVPPYQFNWNINPPQNAAVATNLCSGNYSITVTDSNNCTINNTFTINTNTLISSDFIASVTTGIIPLTVNFTYTGIGANSWYWNFGDGNTSTEQNPSHIFNEMGLYNVILTVNSGAPDSCISSSAIIIEAVLPSEVKIPNVFTPNRDGINDIFTVANKGLETANMKIFNRWGKLVAEWDGAQGGWDGTINGIPASEGVYYYIFTAKGFDKVEYNYNGIFSLMR